MDLSFFEFVGDGIGNDDIVNEVKAQLENKYKIKVIPDRIGNRYGQDENSIVTVYYHLEGEENLIFSAKYNLETKELNDDFFYRKVCYELEKCITTLLLNRNVLGLIRVEMVNKNSLEENISLKDFLLKYPNVTFLAYIVLKGKYEDVFILNLYKDILSQYNISEMSAFVFYSEQDEFEKAKEKIGDLENYSKSMLSKYFKNPPSIYKTQERMMIKVK